MRWFFNRMCNGVCGGNRSARLETEEKVNYVSERVSERKKFEIGLDKEKVV